MLSEEKRKVLLEQGGIVNLNKPVKMTSHDCVAKMRSVFGIKKIGHTGTLDPMATGVLPICIGPATRAAEYFEADFKSYRCAMFLGMNTDTLDIWGSVQSDERSGLRPFFKKNPEIVKSRVLEAISGLRGKILQYPPMYSAVRVDGKRLYEYAREGIEKEVAPREVFIRNLELIDVIIDDMVVVFDVTCSKGTYVRSLCEEIGRRTFWGGCMAELVRTRSGVFSIENAHKFSDIQSMSDDELLSSCIAIDDALPDLGAVSVDILRGSYFKNGGKLALRDCEFLAEPGYADRVDAIREDFKRMYRVYQKREDIGAAEFLGIGLRDVSAGIIIPDKVFKR